jgi:hypothetical protein
MQCKCGAETLTGSHGVKTLKKGQEWFSGTTEYDLPLMIYQDRCHACTRLAYSVVNRHRTLIKRQ